MQTPVMTVSNLSFAYADGNFAIRDINFSVCAGECVSIIGPNGAGKTTLLRALLHRITPHTGDVSVNGTNVGKMSLQERCKQMSFVPQFYRTPSFTVWEYVGLGFVSQMSFGQLRYSVSQQERIDEVLMLLDIAKYAKRPLHTLSGGERQLARIAQALVTPPTVLLMDEPISHLDVKHTVQILDTIRILCDSHKMAVILVVHDLNCAIRCSEKILMMKNGDMLRYAHRDDVINEEVLHDLFDCSFETVIRPQSGIPAVFPL